MKKKKRKSIKFTLFSLLAIFGGTFSTVVPLVNNQNVVNQLNRNQNLGNDINSNEDGISRAKSVGTIDVSNKNDLLKIFKNSTADFGSFINSFLEYYAKVESADGDAARKMIGTALHDAGVVDIFRFMPFTDGQTYVADKSVADSVLPDMDISIVPIYWSHEALNLQSLSNLPWKFSVTPSGDITVVIPFDVYFRGWFSWENGLALYEPNHGLQGINARLYAHLSYKKGGSINDVQVAIHGSEWPDKLHNWWTRELPTSVQSILNWRLDSHVSQRYRGFMQNNFSDNASKALDLDYFSNLEFNFDNIRSSTINELIGYATGDSNLTEPPVWTDYSIDSSTNKITSSKDLTNITADNFAETLLNGIENISKDNDVFSYKDYLNEIQETQYVGTFKSTSYMGGTDFGQTRNYKMFKYYGDTDSSYIWSGKNNLNADWKTILQNQNLANSKDLWLYAALFL